MNKLIIIFLFAMAAGRISAQNCTNLNSPAAISDLCMDAPFLCGNYLENYCGTNAGLTDDIFGQSSGFLRLSPCDSTLELRVSVSNCATTGTGLIFRLHYEGCEALIALSSDTIFNNSTDTLIIQNLNVLETYVLGISGLQGSQCEFNIQVVDGMGTALPGPANCSCSNGAIDGPDKICSGQPVTYTVTLPTCTGIYGPPVGGNGEYCSPPMACPPLDSFLIVWHIPSVMHFVGDDSTGLDVVIALDSNYMGLDTLLLDSIWVSWQLIPTTPTDSLTFCVCTGAVCSGRIPAKMISIGYDIRKYACTLTCASPTCVIEGITYTAPGFYTYEPEACVRVEVTISQDSPNPPIVFNQNICEGQTASLFIVNFDPGYMYQWNTGETGPFINVSPGTSTSYSVTAISANCFFTTIAMVIVTPGTTLNLPPVTICEGDCYNFYGQQVCTSTTVTHIENCTTYVQQVIVGPSLVTNLGTIGSISCAQPCFNFEGADYCAAGEYTVLDGQCGLKKFNIIFEKEIINLGEVGSITCVQTCVFFDGNNYCQAGNYSLSDNCSIRNFSVGEDITPPVCSTPFPDCLPNNIQFTVAFSISGSAPFKVDGLPLSGSYFLSNPILNGTQYAFIVEQANGCQTVVSGSHDCAQLCTTDAGKLAAETLEGCVGQGDLQVTSLVQATLAPGDVQTFALQTDDGMIIGYNATGNFAFDPATMQAEEVYYATRIVGPPNANGIPDLSSACADSSSSQPLVFHGLPNVSLSGDSSLCEGGMLTLTASGANTYLWNDGATGKIKEIPSVEEAQQGIYSVTGTDLNGCKNVDSTEVVIRPQQSEGCCRPQLPNAFTPNGDGANDSFIPILPDCNPLEFAEMRIYSRWGELVFQSTKIDERWDGTNPNGSPASSDTYIFTFRYRLKGDAEKTEKGDITLLR